MGCHGASSRTPSLPSRHTAQVHAQPVNAIHTRIPSFLPSRKHGIHTRPSRFPAQIIGLKQVEHVMHERKVMAMCDHPFLLTMEGWYQDSKEIYMLLELALGGELFSVTYGRREPHHFPLPPYPLPAASGSSTNASCASM